MRKQTQAMQFIKQSVKHLLGYETKTARRHRMARHLRGTGVEIGALHEPLFWSLPGRVHQVIYVDRMTTPALQEHYPELDGQPLVEVAVQADAHRLPFGDETLDFIVANHVIEHMQNVFGVLGDFHRMLKPHAVLYMAVPDKRFTFDQDRPLTPFAHLLAEYKQPHTIAENRHEHLTEFAREVFGRHNRLFAPDDAAKVQEVVETLLARDYSPHYHVWEGETFLQHIRQMNAALPFAYTITDTALVGKQDGERYDEFIVVLQKA